MSDMRAPLAEKGEWPKGAGEIHANIREVMKLTVTRATRDCVMAMILLHFQTLRLRISWVSL